MFEESLKEQLNIPTIGGTLIAEYGFRSDAWGRAKAESSSGHVSASLLKKFMDRSVLENYEFRWRVSFWFDGPDRRYNGAGADLSEAGLLELIHDFEMALNITQQLGTTKFSGTYHKRVGEAANPSLWVVGIGGVFGLQFSMSNDSRTLWKTIPAESLPEAISQLKSALVRGPQLLDILRSVTQTNRLASRNDEESKH